MLSNTTKTKLKPTISPISFQHYKEKIKERWIISIYLWKFLGIIIKYSRPPLLTSNKGKSILSEIKAMQTRKLYSSISMKPFFTARKIHQNPTILSYPSKSKMDQLLKPTSPSDPTPSVFSKEWQKPTKSSHLQPATNPTQMLSWTKSILKDNS